MSWRNFFKNKILLIPKLFVNVFLAFRVMFFTQSCVTMEWFINGEVCVNGDFFQTCLSVQTSSWHISVSVACVWLTDAPWARRGLRRERKRTGAASCVRWTGQDGLTASDRNHNLTSFSPVSLSPAHHAWPPRVTRVFTSLHTHLLTVNMTYIQSGTLWIVTSVSSVRSWYDQIHTNPICHRGWSASFPLQTHSSDPHNHLPGQFGTARLSQDPRRCLTLVDWPRTGQRFTRLKHACFIRCKQ